MPAQISIVMDFEELNEAAGLADSHSNEPGFAQGTDEFSSRKAVSGPDVQPIFVSVFQGEQVEAGFRQDFFPVSTLPKALVGAVFEDERHVVHMFRGIERRGAFV